MRHRRRRQIRIGVAIALGTLIALPVALSPTGPVAAATIASAGPLRSITISDQLNCDVRHSSDTAAEWYNGTACGTFAALDGVLYGPASIPAGSNASPKTSFTAVSQSAVTGAGTSANPYSVTTVVALGNTGVRITQVDRYVVGQEIYATAATISNLGTATRSGFLYTAGDCYLQNSDLGYGRVSGTSPACTASTAPGSRVEQLLPATGGNTYIEGFYADVWRAIGLRGPLPNTHRGNERIDNAIGLGWPVSLAPGASATFSWSTVFSPTGLVPHVISVDADQPDSLTNTTNGYRITVNNDNSTATTLSAVTLTLPIGFTYQSGSTTGATTANPTVSGRTLTWSGSFPVSAGGTFQIHLGVDVGTTPGTFTVDATAASPSAPMATVTATAPIRVRERVDLAMQKTLSAPSAPAGTQITATLTATNTGSTTATGVVVTDTVPSGFTLAAGSSAGCTQSGNLVTCSVGTIAGGASAVRTLVLSIASTVVPGAAGDTATVATTDQVDTVPSNNAATASVTVTRSADLSFVKTGPATVVPGTTVTFTLTTTNNGPSLATNVAVADSPPAGMTIIGLVSSDPSAVCTPATGGCRHPQLAVGASVIVTVTASVSPSVSTSTIDNFAGAQSTDTPDPNFADNTQTLVVPNAPRADLTISKTGPDTVTAGAPARYVVTVTNNGPSDASNIVITDTLTTGVLRGASTTPTCSLGAPATSATCTLANLPAGQSTSVALDLVVPPTTPAGGIVTNTATVTASTTDPTPVNTAVKTSTVVRSVDLMITKADDPDSPLAGTALTYTLTVQNKGPSVASAVVVTDTLPAAFSASGIVISDGTPCTDLTSPIVCTLPVLAVGPPVTITISGTVSAGATPGIAIQNTATVASSEPERNSSDNTSSVFTDITAEAGLDIVKNASADPAVAGGAFSYTLIASNLGPSNAAGGVTLTDPLPAALLEPDVDRDDLCDISDGVLECTIGALNVGTPVTITVSGTIDPATPAGTQLENVATLLRDGSPAAESGDSTTVTREADLDITKTTLGGGQAVAGEAGGVSWEIVVENNGPSQASGVTVIDTPDSRVSLTGVTGATCDVTPRQASCDVGTLAPGAEVTLTVTGTVSPDVLGGTVLTNLATVTSNESDATADAVSDDATVTIVQEADLEISKVASLPQAPAGGDLTYTVTVVNHGPSTATGIVVTDQLPGDVALRPLLTTSGCVNSTPIPGTVTCSGAAIPSLAPGTQAVFRIVVAVSPAAGGSLQNVVSVDADQPEPSPDPNPSNFTLDTPVTDAVELAVVKTGPTDALAGAEFTWTVTVTNHGPASARNLVISDTLPAGATIGTPSIGPVGSCSPVSGRTLTCTVGSPVPIAGQVTVQIPVTIDPASLPVGQTVSPVSNQVDVTSDNTQLGDGRSFTLSTPIVQSAHVRVFKDDPLEPARAGLQFEFTMELTNDGPGAASNVQVVDTLPEGLTFVEDDLGACQSDDGRTVTCNVGTLTVGESIELVVVVDVASDLGDDSVLVNIADVTWDQVDSNPALPSAAAATYPVEADFDLSIDKSVTPEQGRPGDALTYTLTIANAGPGVARDITIEDPLAGRVDFVGIVKSSPDCAADSQRLLCSVPDLMPNDSVTIEVSAAIPADAQPGQLVNTVSVDAEGTELTPENNVDSATVTVLPPSADLSVRESASPTQAAVGDRVTFTMGVSNAGPDAAVGVVVQDPFPAGLVIAEFTASAGSFDPATGAWTVGDMAAGADATLVVTATAVAPGVWTDTIAARSATGDPDAANNSASATVTVVAAASTTTTPATTAPATTTTTIDTGAGGNLPRTGGGALNLVVFGLGLVVLGLIVSGGRRRRPT